MGLYKFKSNGPAYGLGHTENELVVIDEETGIQAMALVPEVAKNDKGQMVNTGRQVMAKKDYSVAYLIEQQVIVPATAADQKAYKEQDDINSKADRAAAATSRHEKKSKNARILALGGKVADEEEEEDDGGGDPDKGKGKGKGKGKE